MAAASVLAGRGFWMLVVVFALLPHAERLSVLAITLEELHTAPDSFIPTSIAFGSCAKSHLNTDQELWHSVLRGKPDLWVWMGDNIYPNEDEDPNNPNKDLEEKRREYQRQSRKAGYRQLASEVAVVGVWDDHDYGGDDSGKDYPRKQASKDLLMEFLREPEDSPRRQRGGVYISYTLGAPGRQIKLILLDTRWFQDPPGESSSLLGSVQWDWLVQELQGTGQALNVLVSSIQVVNGDSIMSENWRQWPIDHSRLTNTLNQEDTPPTIILSGDRHYGEMARDCDVGADWGGLLEITSSGVTQHRPAKFTIFDCNPYRVTGVMDQINYGTLHVDWEEGVVSAHIHAQDGTPVASQSVAFRQRDNATTCKTGTHRPRGCGEAFLVFSVALLALPPLLFVMAAIMFLTGRRRGREEGMEGTAMHEVPGSSQAKSPRTLGYRRVVEMVER